MSWAKKLSKSFSEAETDNSMEMPYVMGTDSTRVSACAKQLWKTTYARMKGAAEGREESAWLMT